MEMDRIPREGFPIIGLWISGFKRSFSFSNLLFPLKLIVSLIHSLLIILRFRPQIVIGTGGFASGPLLQVATWLNYPTLIQEQNSYPGITNRILGKNVDRICVAFDLLACFLCICLYFSVCDLQPAFLMVAASFPANLIVVQKNRQQCQ